MNRGLKKVVKNSSGNSWDLGHILPKRQHNSTPNCINIETNCAATNKLKPKSSKI